MRRLGYPQSEEVAGTLHKFGTPAGFLIDGFNGWELPTRRILPSGEAIRPNYLQIRALTVALQLRRR
jgi:hypothetical protein